MIGCVAEERPLSPRGRGMRRLSERSELSRSRVRGRAAGAQRASAALARYGAIFLALLRARAPLGARPLIQLRLSSLRSLRLRILLPQGEKGYVLRAHSVALGLSRPSRRPAPNRRFRSLRAGG